MRFETSTGLWNDENWVIGHKCIQEQARRLGLLASVFYSRHARICVYLWQKCLWTCITAIDETKPKVVLKALRIRLSTHFPKSQIGRKSGWETKVRQCSKWVPVHLMKNELYTTVRDRQECTQNEPVSEKLRTVELFPESGWLNFVTMDILRPLQKTLKCNQFILEMKDLPLKILEASWCHSRPHCTLRIFFG